MSRDRGARRDTNQPESHALRNAIIAGLIVAFFGGSSAPWWIPIVFGNGASPTPRATTPPSTEAPTALAGCVITLSPIAQLHQEPDPASPPMNTVDGGEYVSTRSETISGGNVRLFEITVDGQTGWVWDNPAEIRKKTTDCASL